MTDAEAEQIVVCSKYGSDYVPVPSSSKIGISEDINSGHIPINGLRHIPVGDTSGWYLWAGDEPEQSCDYFKPLHIEHLRESHPTLMKFMGLAPGWRFLVAPNHEDVWFDQSLLVE